MDRRPPSRQSPDHPRHVGSKAKNGHEQQYDNSSRPANQAEAREPEMQMNMRKTMAPASSQGKTKKFPPEADETFGVVLEKDVAAWREKLNATYGIGDGRLVVIEDPAAG